MHITLIATDIDGNLGTTTLETNRPWLALKSGVSIHAIREVDEIRVENDNGSVLHQPYTVPMVLAENARLRAALTPFAAMGEKLIKAGKDAIPDEATANFLTMDDIQAKHFRKAADLLR